MTKKDITYQEKLNELRLDISHPNNSNQVFILVEGESDIRLFRKFFNLDNCKVECIPGGNPRLEDCVEELIKVYPLVLGIRDSDFIKLDTIPYSKTNMFLTDNHDMEMSLVCEDEVFSALVFEYSDIPKQHHFDARNNILKILEQLSYLKYLNYIQNLELKFESGFQDLISFANREIDFDQYFSRVLSKSPNARINDLSVILNEIDSLKRTNPNPFQLCNGHDFIKAFSHFAKNNGKQNACNHETISSAFRMNFRNEYFLKTQLYNDTKNWADINHCIIHV
ncbi:DUF4435 domain-containing protein [Mucilaginibacter sp. X5P1]|uniref:DUF4435 domain-containing protein n=1 Tax=Mucilaginibacter sp. X5P1 TaxID=2723088 RepID=UPI00161E5B16|nr:DUF4435 domain-containing protein [Mucilaginibacter sp. X5P1]MBB6141967.1 hypothetical protein [Mucilaginibacter sp. X5P1]